MNYDQPDINRFHKEEELENELDSEMAEIASWISRQATVRAAWMERGFFFTDDIASPLGHSRRSVNARLFAAGCSPVIGGRKLWEGNNLWAIESLSKLSGDNPDKGTRSGGLEEKGSRKPSGATKPQRTAKRSTSKKA